MQGPYVVHRSRNRGNVMGEQREVSSRAAASRAAPLWKPGVEAGIAAGALFLLLEYLTTFLGATSPLGPANITFRQIINLSPTEPAQGYTAVVIVLHFGLALATTLVLATFIRRIRTYWAVTFGIVYGLLLYGINFFVFAIALPAITAASDGFMLANYMIYGGAAAWIYKVREHAIAGSAPRTAKTASDPPSAA